MNSLTEFLVLIAYQANHYIFERNKINFTCHRLEHSKTDLRSTFSSETLAVSVPRCDSFVHCAVSFEEKPVQKQPNPGSFALERDLRLFAGV